MKHETKPNQESGEHQPDKCIRFTHVITLLRTNTEHDAIKMQVITLLEYLTYVYKLMECSFLHLLFAVQLVYKLRRITFSE